jgi:hypothetical protein
MAQVLCQPRLSHAGIAHLTCPVQGQSVFAYAPHAFTGPSPLAVTAALNELLGETLSPELLWTLDKIEAVPE